MSLQDILVRNATDRAAGIVREYPHHRTGGAAPVQDGPCRFRGAPTGESVDCATCSGRVSLKLFACAVHGSCSPQTAIPGRACCGGCPNYSNASPPPARHLLYHIYPLASGAAVWRRGIDQLRARWSLFTGHKIVAVLTGPGLAPVSEVIAHLPPECEVLALPNNPKLREVATWVPLWDWVLARVRPSDAVFYAHAKGVTRPDDPGNSCHWWASLQYSLLLDHLTLVDSQLDRYPITGAFKKLGPAFDGQVPWHYSGTFFWVRAGDFAARPWRNVPQKWWGTEAWPGLAYRAPEAGCVFHEARAGVLNLYDVDYWQAVVRPAYAKWIIAHPAGVPV